jgi:RND superfamily putative drug exporter
MFSRWYEFVDRRPWRVVGASLLVLAVAGAVAVTLFARLWPYGALDPSSQSSRADAVLARTGVAPEAAMAVLVRTATPARSQAAQSELARVVAIVRHDPVIARVITWQTGGSALISRDGHETLSGIYVKAGTSDKAQQDAAGRLETALRPVRGAVLGGNAVAFAETNTISHEDLAIAELLALPLLSLLSFIFFRSLVAALLPTMIAMVANVLTLFGLQLASQGTVISVFALNLVTALTYGLGVDYSLLIVGRYREELRRHGPGRQALLQTMGTAGRTVAFSSVTVAAALAALIVFPERLIRSDGIGGAIAALSCALGALVLLPAVLSLLGTKVNALAPRALQRAAEREAQPLQEGFWYRLAQSVIRRPAVVATGTALVMLAIAAPATGLALGFVDANQLPPGQSARTLQDAVQRDFAVDETYPIVIALGTADHKAVDAFAARVRALPGATGVAVAGAVPGGYTELQAFSSAGPAAPASVSLVKAIRALPSPEPVLVTGRTATFSIDLQHSIATHLPAALAIVFGVTLLALFLFTGSVVLPLEAVLMNALTLAATFGLLTVIFQDGWGDALLGYSSRGMLEIDNPIVVFAVVFGLSTDYMVFLLSRIREARRGAASEREAIAVGLERTGRIVTAAALLVAVALGALCTSRIDFIKELALGVALAVLLDATLVRGLLVPSTMALLGKWNWWAPAPLRRLHELIGLSDDGGAAPAPAAAGPEPVPAGAPMYATAEPGLEPARRR